MTRQFCSCPACQHVMNVKLGALEASLRFDHAQRAWTAAQAIAVRQSSSENAIVRYASSK